VHYVTCELTDTEIIGDMLFLTRPYKKLWLPNLLNNFTVLLSPSN